LQSDLLIASLKLHIMESFFQSIWRQDFLFWVGAKFPKEKEPENLSYKYVFKSAFFSSDNRRILRIEEHL
jgi:hypothetical protein